MASVSNKIGLIALQQTNFPNYALMKISNYYKKQGCEVEWYLPILKNTFQKVFASSIFSYDNKIELDESFIKGGTGFDFNIKLPKEIDDAEPDYTIYNNLNYSIGFLTRGCNRQCHFCIVHKKEGSVKIYRDIELIAKHKKVVLMDNNILQLPTYAIAQFDKIIKMGLRIDFNQGMDHRLIDSTIAKRLAKIKWINQLRLSCDNIKDLDTIIKTIELLRRSGVKPIKYFIYHIVQHIEESEIVIKELNKLNLKIFAQPYIAIDSKIKYSDQSFNEYCRYVNIGFCYIMNFQRYLEKFPNRAAKMQDIYKGKQ